MNYIQHQYGSYYLYKYLKIPIYFVYKKTQLGKLCIKVSPPLETAISPTLSYFTTVLNANKQFKILLVLTCYGVISVNEDI